MDLQQKGKALPECPGVYMMRDSYGIVIYVGKSKNIKKRVTSYFTGTDRYTRKLENLMRNMQDFEYLTTDTEFEALMLECELIGRYKPAYNRQMKNPKSYCYIRIDIAAELPEVKVVLEKTSDCFLYYGPYNSRATLQEAIDIALHSFGIRCDRNKRKQTPCLNDELALCNGICSGKTTPSEYRQAIEQIIELIDGTGTTIVDKLTIQMSAAADAFDFETAALCRNKLSTLQYVTSKSKIVEYTKTNRKLILLETVGTDDVKLIVLSNYEIVYAKRFTLSSSATLIEEATFWAIKLTQQSKELPLGYDEKASADKAHIIYNHLNRFQTSLWSKPIDDCLNLAAFQQWLHETIKTLHQCE